MTAAYLEIDLPPDGRKYFIDGELDQTAEGWRFTATLNGETIPETLDRQTFPVRIHTARQRFVDEGTLVFKDFPNTPTHRLLATVVGSSLRPDDD